MHKITLSTIAMFTFLLTGCPEDDAKKEDAKTDAKADEKKAE